MSNERIFYFCHSHNEPSGGQKHTYRHVDILNDNGYEAYAFHSHNGFRLTWFENDTRVVDETGFRQLYDPQRDYVVLPADLGPRILQFPGRKVVFDKSLYYGSRALGLTPLQNYPYHCRDVIAVFSVSDHNQRHLQFAYPDLDIYRVYPGICKNNFAYRPFAEKMPQVTTVPKAIGSVAALHHLIQARAMAQLNNGSRFQWLLLSSRSERETAAILADSMLFIFMNTEEGLPRMPLEAMASGCVVVTPDAGPLRECVPRECRFEPGDLVAMAKFIERVMESFPGNLQQWEPMLRNQRAVALEYSMERQERSVLFAWDEIRRRQLRNRHVARTSLWFTNDPIRGGLADQRLSTRQYYSSIMSLVAGNRLICPFCMSRFKRFLPFASDTEAINTHAVIGAGFRHNAVCPQCHSRDRERLVYLYLTGPGAGSWQRILHVAPERNLGKFLSNSARILYVSGNLVLDHGPVRTQFDLTSAPFRDELFDLIVCNHVLGNIPDDRCAMEELYRLLVPQGLAILQVPISRKLRATYEDFSLSTEQQRFAAFGHKTQVRIYGRDYCDRLRQVGFDVQEVRPSNWLSPSAVRQYALVRGEVLFVCRKQDDAQNYSLPQISAASRQSAS